MELKFRAIFNQAMQLMGVLDPEGRLLEVNRVALEFAGVPATEVIGRPFWETPWWRHSPELADRVRDAVARAAAGESVCFETTHPHCGGSPRVVDFSITPVKDPYGVVRYLIPVGHDVSERKQTEEELKLWHSVFTNTTDGIMITDVEGMIRSVNPAFTEITGHSADEALGKNPRILKSGSQNADFYAEMWRALASRGKWSGDFWNVRKNGEVYPQETSIAAVRGPSGDVTHYVAIFRDVSERKKLEEQLRLLSAVDGLTGIANRRSLDEALAGEWRRCARAGEPLSLILADIDHFKLYNDTYGHLGGDDCLRTVAGVIRDSVHRAGDLPARFGGEEFAVVLGSTDAAAALLVAEKIRSGVEALAIPHAASATSGCVTLSLGVGTLFPGRGGSVEDVVALADGALYAAKGAGRNRVALAGGPRPEQRHECGGLRGCGASILKPAAEPCDA